MKKKNLTRILAFVLCVVMVVPVLAACNNYETGLRFRDSGEYTYSAVLNRVPNTWNPHTYGITLEGTLLSYISTPFYDYTVEPGSEMTYTGGQTLMLEAARSMPKRVYLTPDQQAKYGLTENNNPDSGYAWAIPLNYDLKWDNGDPIVAQDFVDSMELCLEKARKNRNVGGEVIKGHSSELANGYAYYNPPLPNTPDASALYNGHSAGVIKPPAAGATPKFLSLTKTDAFLSLLWSSNNSIYGRLNAIMDAADPADPADANLVAWINQNGVTFKKLLDDVKALESVHGYVTIGDGQGEVSQANVQTIAEAYAYIIKEWTGYNSTGTADLWKTICYSWDGTTYLQSKQWSDVGIYADTATNSLVYVYTMPKTQKDMTLIPDSTYLVHKATYTSSANQSWKDELLTTTYNTTKETTRSWGPYSLVTVQADKEMIYEKNPYWMGFNDTSKIVPDTDEKDVGKTYGEKYKNYYQTSRIYFQIVADADVTKLMFAKGQIDTIGVDIDQVETFNKYPDNWRRTPDGSVWGFNLLTDLNALKAISDAPGNTAKNVEILAVPEFREALSRGFDRKTLTKRYYVGSVPAFKLMTGVQLLRQIYDANIMIQNYPQYNQGIVDILGLADKIGAGKQYSDNADAVKWATGYELDYAKKLFNIAYARATGGTFDGVNYASDEFAGIYADSKGMIEINCYIPAGQTSFDQTEEMEYGELKAMWESSVAGTPLAGKLKITFVPLANSNQMYADIRAKKIEMALWATGGVNLAAINVLTAYGNPYNPDGSINDMFSFPGFDPTDATVKVTLKQAYTLTGYDYKLPYTLTVGENTLTVGDWIDIYQRLHFDYLLAANPKQVDMSKLEDDMVSILCATEVAIVKGAAFIPYFDTMSSVFYGHKVTTASTVYNIYAGFGGGVKQRIYKYDDAEWQAFVKKNRGNLY